MEPVFELRSVTLNSGDRLDLKPGTILVLVGPNNAGKSSLLRSIKALVRDKHSGSRILSHVEYETGSLERLFRWMSDSLYTRTAGRDEAYCWFGVSFPRGRVENMYERREDLGLSEIADVLISHEAAEDRLTVGSACPSFNPVTATPSHPLQALFLDDALERRLCQSVRTAFGSDLVVNRAAGSHIVLHLGEAPTFAPGEDRVSAEYLRRLIKLPTLQEQGDGVRSFVGCLLLLETSPAKLQLIDEPDAFLHPPQARMLGRVLSGDAPPDKQLVVATHSPNVLKGILDSGSDRVAVARVTREGRYNRARMLATRQLAELWSDPLLRHSEVFDGLFHDLVVVCEADSDCRFFTAIAAVLAEDSRLPETLFVPTGGKERLHVVARALRELGVPTRVVADLDLLDNAATLERVIVSLGGDWTDYRDAARNVRSSLLQVSPPLETEQVRIEIDQIVGSVDDRLFPEGASDRIRKTLRRTSPWKNLKLGGVSLLKGRQRKDAEDLISQLETLGLFVLRIGELERFVPDAAGHGPRWVTEALQRNLMGDDLKVARNFVSTLLDLAADENHGV